MLRIQTQQIFGYSIEGNIGNEFYAFLLPLTHESGAAWWIVDTDNGEPFTDSDGTVYQIRKRSLAEIQAEEMNLPAYITQAAQRIDTEVNAFVFGHFNLGASLGFLKKHTRLTNKKAVKNQDLTTEEQAQLTACEAVDEWSRQVMVYAYAKIDDVLECETISEVDAVTLDFDGLFGAAGTQLPKPAVSVRDFLTSP
jgi:hypothetical protein